MYGGSKAVANLPVGNQYIVINVIYKYIKIRNKNLYMLYSIAITHVVLIISINQTIC